MVRWALVAIVSIWVSSPAQAAVAILGKVDAGVRATLGAANSQQTDTQSVFVPGTGDAVQASVNSVLRAAGNTSIDVSTIAEGSWSSANAGRIDLRWGWVIEATNFSGVARAETNLTPSNWTYSFTATSDGFFQGTYSVIGGGQNRFGLQALRTGGDWTSGQLGGSVSDPTGSGTFSVALTRGRTYTMSLANNGNVSLQAGRTAGVAIASVDWEITSTPVPEPQSWALLIVGFGVVGAALRQRRFAALA